MEGIVNTGWFRRIELQVLMNLTARALRQPPRRTWTMSNGEALRFYAEFTRNQLQGGVSSDVLSRMNDEAYRLGRLLRRVLFLRRQSEVERVVVALYRNIGIRLEGSIPGSLCFRSCYFARFYTPEVCRAASALDDGIIRGLSGSGPLVFRQRITEGHPCCLANALKFEV